MSHPSLAQLLDVALGPPRNELGAFRHVAECAQCREEVALLREGAAEVARDPADAPGPACLGPSTLGALADGTLTGEARAGALAHLASCATCREELALLAEMLADPGVRRELRALDRATTPRRLLRIGLPLAAAAALLIVVARPFGFLPGGNHRATVVSLTPTPTLIAPVGSVAAVPSFAWRAIPGADLYRVTLFDASGLVVLEDEGADTTLMIPDSVALTEGGTYLWRVEARVGWDRWVGTPLTRFEFVPQRP